MSVAVYFAAVIPALNPQKQLYQYVQQLYHTGISNIVIINDGSDEEYKPIFDELALYPFCEVLTNVRNHGKGFSIKRGFRYVLQHFSKYDGVFTIGAHGQHDLQDVRLMIKMTQIFSDSMMIGVRNMESPNVTWMQYMSSRLTTVLFQLLYRKKLLDTQSGLRYFPLRQLPWLLNIEGNGFHYDTNVLIEAIRFEKPIYEIAIGTIQVKKNTLMHYDEILSMQEIMHYLVKQFQKRRNYVKGANDGE